VSTKQKSELKMPAYGGQAVIEGVMMRGKRFLAMAVRDPHGQIQLHEEELPAIYSSKWMRVPFLRGILALWDSLSLGTRMISLSANISGTDDEQIDSKSMALVTVLSLVIGVAVFFLLPAFVAGWLDKHFTLGPWWSNVIEGVLRLFLLIAYMALVGQMKDIRRVYAYHGAEHKTINAYEANVALTPSETAKQSTQHPRCGTSFMLTLALISVLVFSLLGPMPIYWRLISRILMLPLVAGIAYEYIRWVAKYMDDSAFLRWIIKPNLALQKLTTREPSEDMLEVAIAAFNRLLELEEGKDTVKTPEKPDTDLSA